MTSKVAPLASVRCPVCGAGTPKGLTDTPTSGRWECQTCRAIVLVGRMWPKDNPWPTVEPTKNKEP